jgi:hypothetical protein
MYTTVLSPSFARLGNARQQSDLANPATAFKNCLVSPSAGASGSPIKPAVHADTHVSVLCLYSSGMAIPSMPAVGYPIPSEFSVVSRVLTTMFEAVLAPSSAGGTARNHGPMPEPASA